VNDCDLEDGTPTVFHYQVKID